MAISDLYNPRGKGPSRGSPGTGRRPIPLYELLAEELSLSIGSHLFAPGDRMPSLRSCARGRGVSIPTVNEAYRLLEDRGLVESRPRSGYYVVQPRAGGGAVATDPGAVRVPAAARPTLVSASISGVLPFGAAIPGAGFFPVRRLNSIMSGLLRRKPLMLGDYEFAPGLPELRRQVAKRALAWNCSLEWESVVVTNGGVEATALCLQAVTCPGNIVAVERPTFYGFLYLLEAQGLRALEIPTDPKDGLVVSALEEALGRHEVSACLISTTVTNPTGATMPETEKQRLVLLLEAARVPLIEDATFADLHRAGARPAAKAYDRTGNVMLCASLTKTVAPGLRLGWADAGIHASRVGFLKRVSSIGQPTVIQETIAAYLGSGGVERHLRRLRATFAKLVDRHLDAVSRHLPTGTRVVAPSGGFLLWVELPEGIDTTGLHPLALEVGLGIAPGSMFSATGAFAAAMRINCGVEWDEATEVSYERLGRLVALRC